MTNPSLANLSLYCIKNISSKTTFRSFSLVILSSMSLQMFEKMAKLLRLFSRSPRLKRSILLSDLKIFEFLKKLFSDCDKQAILVPISLSDK